jgi:hypothetical protein
MQQKTSQEGLKIKNIYLNKKISFLFFDFMLK